MKDNSLVHKTGNKLRSETGASITFALLLFLVCAALSAVVLVAATTAAGRMKNIAESDQRYYSVTSAAEFVCDMLDDRSVSEVTIDKVGTYTFSRPMNEITDDVIKRAAYINPEKNDGIIDSSGKQTDGEDHNERTYPDPGTLISDDPSLASAVFGLNEGQSLELTFKNSDGNAALIKHTDGSLKDAMAVTITMEKKDTVSETVELSLQNKYGKGKYKILMSFGYHERNVNPPVTKIEDKAVTGKEIKWELNRMVSSFDADK